MQVLTEQHRVPIKMWTDGVVVEPEALQQLRNVASLPFIFKHIAVMPDVHWGMGATVGSVIPTRGAVIPAAVGVDIGCGMIAARTPLVASDLPDNLVALRTNIEWSIPVGKNAYKEPKIGEDEGNVLLAGLKKIIEKHPKVARNQARVLNQVGTLGGGNHFIELCLDTEQRVWIMLHSGSRNIGNVIGMYFTELAREDMKTHFINLPDRDLGYLSEGTAYFDDYVEAVSWAQSYALENRRLMLDRILDQVQRAMPKWELGQPAEVIANCHHNYLSREHHFGENIIVTRKGAVSAREGQMGIIPGSMGTRSYIVRGKGNAESFTSCSHGAGRRMSRTKAKASFTVEDHIKATEGVECRKDDKVLDETPAAYKDIDAVIAAQSDLVEVVHTLKQVLCVKG